MGADPDHTSLKSETMLPSRIYNFLISKLISVFFLKDTSGNISGFDRDEIILKMMECNR